jgi:hypothetical protein
MEDRMRKVLGFALGLFAIGAIAHLGIPSVLGQTAPQDEVAKRFVGMWRLVSAPSPTHGQNPTGFIIYDKSGNMAAQIMPDRPRPKFAGTQPTPEEAKEALIGYTAYFGTYTVDATAKITPTTQSDLWRETRSKSWTNSGFANSGWLATTAGHA